MKNSAGLIQKLRDAANGQNCVRCGISDDTCVLAHYVGPRRNAYGGGMGHKGHDAIGAWLCTNCHRSMDKELKELGGKESRWLYSEEFLHLCALTIIQLFKQGIVK